MEGMFKLPLVQLTTNDLLIEEILEIGIQSKDK